MQAHEARNTPSASRHLPWVAVALVVVAYLLTLDRTLSAWNLPVLSTMNGWDWRPPSLFPLQWLVSLPASWLPVGVQPFALSLISAICAGLSLALLARTVTILPQERTRLHRQRALQPGGILPASIAWLPACLAVLVFGLQQTVWQNATQASQDILDLLLFAYIVRAIAEHRLDSRDAWLHKAALVYGLAIVNNFAMIAYLPIFIGSLIWIKGRSFFSASFLIRFTLLGSAGLLLYLLIPTLHALSDTSTNGFWRTLRSYVGAQKGLLFSYNRVSALLLGSVSLIPLLGLAFRWGEAGGDVSGASHTVTIWLTHLIAVSFLTLCIASAFDFRIGGVAQTVIGVASIAAKSGNPSVLSIFFLGAVSIGYYAGYLLLVFGTIPVHRWSRPSALGKKIMAGVVGLLALVTLAIPSLLVYRNGPILARAHGGSELAQLGRRLIQTIPDDSFVISDTPLFHQLIQATAFIQRRSAHIKPVESGALELPIFHSHQRKLLSTTWPPLIREYDPTNRIPYSTVSLLLTHLSLSNRVYYSEPSFGYFFESHFLSPTGMIYQLHPLPVGLLDAESLTPASARATEAFWKDVAATDLVALRSSSGSSPSKTEGSDISRSLTQTAYSRSLNYWGVALQHIGQWDSAREAFTQAIQANPKNPCAAINLAQNQFSRTNTSGKLPVTEHITSLLKPFNGQPDVLLRVNGPIDEPEVLTVMAKRFAESGPLYLQSALMLRRAGALLRSPEEYDLGAAKLLSEADRGDLVSKLVTQLRSKASPGFLANVTNQMELMNLDAISLSRSGEFKRGEELMRANIAKHPAQELPYSTLSTLYIQRASNAQRRGQTNEFLEYMLKARATLADQVKAQPKSASAWINYGATFMQLDDHVQAIPAFTQALAVSNNNTTALLNRAICRLKLNQLTEAQIDYEQVRSLQPDAPYQALYGLAEIAYRSQRKKEAADFYEEYLKKAPNVVEREEIQKRLKELKK